jgi:uncharacterized protein (TIGR00297 family)
LNVPTPIQLLVSSLLAGGIVATAHRWRFLSSSGAIAAFVLGVFIFGFGGLPFAIPLLVFFFSSSLLSRLGHVRKAALSAKYDKSSTRDVLQVLANGGVPALCLLYAVLSPSPREGMLLYLAALAEANADTWATEIGSLARGRPRLVTTLRRVDPGTSGGITLQGILAALLGAAFIAGVGWLAWTPESLQIRLLKHSHSGSWLPWPILALRIDPAEFLAVAWAGFLGSLADSILGASIQAQYHCIRCGVQTEHRIHCGQIGRRLQGFRWVTNDTVNLLASLLAVFFAGYLLRTFAYPL